MLVMSRFMLRAHPKMTSTFGPSQRPHPKFILISFLTPTSSSQPPMPNVICRRAFAFLLPFVCCLILRVRAMIRISPQKYFMNFVVLGYVFIAVWKRKNTKSTIFMFHPYKQIPSAEYILKWICIPRNIFILSSFIVLFDDCEGSERASERASRVNNNRIVKTDFVSFLYNKWLVMGSCIKREEKLNPSHRAAANSKCTRDARKLQ